MDLLMNVKHLAVVKSHGDASDLGPVATELKSLLASSRLGSIIFGYATQVVLSSEVARLIEAGLEKLKVETNLTEEKCRLARAEIEASVAALDDIMS
eukprot:6490466-Amphidinium_carterae.2